MLMIELKTLRWNTAIGLDCWKLIVVLLFEPADAPEGMPV
jgi:hypothetical protein